MKELPDKLFFKIGEVADILGVKTHVLRYWESEFSFLRPLKTSGSHRQYRRKDVESAGLIQSLLHEEGYTIAGAKKRLRELGFSIQQGRDEEGELGQQNAHKEGIPIETLTMIREELQNLLVRLESSEPELTLPASAEVKTITVNHTHS